MIKLFIGIDHFIDTVDLLSFSNVFSLEDTFVKQMVFPVLFFQLLNQSIGEGLNDVHFARKGSFVIEDL